MSSLKTVAIILCVHLLCTLVYGNQSSSLTKKGLRNERKRRSDDKESKGHYEVFKVDRINYFLQKVNGSGEESNQTDQEITATTPSGSAKISTNKISTTADGSKTATTSIDKKKSTTPASSSKTSEIYRSSTAISDMKKSTTPASASKISETSTEQKMSTTLASFSKTTETSTGNVLPKYCRKHPVLASVGYCIMHVNLEITGAPVSSILKTTTSTTSSKSLVCPIKILLIGGYYKNESKSSIEVYHRDKGQHNRIISAKLHQPRHGHISALLDDQSVIICGGRDEKINELSSCELLDLITNEISKAKVSMKEARFTAGFAVLHGLLYVCGGYAKKKALSSCEHYKSGRWNSIKSMLNARHGLTMVELHGVIYAIGGTNTQGEDLNIVEQYNPIKDEWIYVSFMKVKRYSHSAAVLRGLLYVCGGYDGNLLSSCEQYNPMNDTWSPSAMFNYGRNHFGMVTAGDHMFALGGDEKGVSVEMYDERKEKWQKLGQHLLYMRIFHSVVVIP